MRSTGLNTGYERLFSLGVTHKGRHQSMGEGRKSNDDFTYKGLCKQGAVNTGSRK